MKIFNLILILFLLVGSSCASLFSSGGWRDVRISSFPPDAKFRIIDEKGKEIVTGTTPQTVPLKGGKAYFMRKTYTVQYYLEGYLGANILLRSKFNPTYCTNVCLAYPLLILVGGLLVDPISGAVYKVDKDKVDVTLVPYTPYNPNDSVLQTNVITDTTIQIKPIVKDSTQLKVNPKVMQKDSIQPIKTAPKEFDYYPDPKSTKRDSL